MDSIIQDEKVCYQTGSTFGLEEHHVYGGHANRKLSEKYGLKIWLRVDWHRDTNYSIHMDRRFRERVQREVQLIAMEHYGWTVEDFRKIFGRSFL